MTHLPGGPGHAGGRAAGWPQALFVYGTLWFPDIVHAILGRVPDRAAGAVAGWRAATLSGRTYPGLVRADGATVRGGLLTGLSAAEWQVIDAFENGEYDLTELSLLDGRRASAYTWVHSFAADATPLPEDWSAEEFAARHLAGYVAHCTEWRRHHESAGG
jgi:gamma-glutamylcyclotransferase (GGCT)/AIG2-like uncharacterized protein YtfP